jgi:hypothetical protein
MAAKRKPAKKAQGWEDSIPFVNMLRKPTAPKSVKSSVKAANKAGRAANAIAREAAVAAFGDPKKGWRDVAGSTALTLAPYGKGAKLINKATKGIKGAKKAKTVRGVAKTAGALGVAVGVPAGVNRIPSKKSAPKKKVR